MRTLLLLFTIALTQHLCTAQTLSDLLKQAEVNYPLLKAKGYEVQARSSQLSFVKSTAVPSLDAAYQVNYSTYNNITGMATAQNFIAISGPPSTSNNYSGVFGSVGGLILAWEPVTFGQRKSAVETARAYLQFQEADAAQEVFQHQIKTVNAYLDVVMMHELIKVYHKNLQRAHENIRIVRSLAKSGLRPGVDTALFNSELSRAKIELLNIEKLKEAQHLILSELVGGTLAEVTIDSSYFNKLPIAGSSNASISHPLITMATNRVRIYQSERIALQRTLNPKLSFWGTTYARGSGIRYDGYVNSADGLSFSRYNYGAGLVLSAPLLRFASVRHQVKAQSAMVAAEQERVTLVKLQLDKQNQLAGVTFTNALRVADESAILFKSSEFAYRVMRSRYQSGLVSFTDFIQAQYSLTKAEVDLKTSYMETWKALLYKSAVEGDLTIFTQQEQ